MRLADVRRTNIVEDIIFSIFSVANLRTTHIRYNIDCKMAIKYGGLLLLLSKLAKNVLAVRMIRVTHFDDRSLCTSTEEDILFMIQAVTRSSKALKKLLHFTKTTFIDTPGRLPDELHVYSFEQDRYGFPTIWLFIHN